jgi:hypothetical protein
MGGVYVGKYFTAFAVAISLAALLTLGPSSALAGVVINQTETVLSGPAGSGQPPQTRQRTIMIEGNKEKMIDGNREMITDLDAGTMDVIDPAHKMYVEIPFPPKGMMGQAAANPSQHADFVATGKTRTVAGYPCEEYKGSGKFAIGEFSMISCVSKTAPGAAEYFNFQKAMIAKVKNGAAPTNLPNGIPMVQDTTTIMKPTQISNMPPQAAAQLKLDLAKRPPLVTRTEVTKVESQKIAASELQVPAGYTKREPLVPAQPPPAPGHPASPSGAPAPASVPKP